MKQFTLRNALYLIVVFWISSNPLHASQPDKNEVVEKMLKNIYPSGKTSFHAGLKVCELSENECGTSKFDNYDRKVKIYLSTIEIDSEDKHSTLVDVYFPERQKKTILHDGIKLYLLLPTTKTPIRIPPQQSLLGDADVGAILDINYAIYEVNELEKSDETVKLEFVNPSSKQQFSKIVLDISLSSFTPVSGDFYSNTGTLIRNATYHDVGKLGDRTTFRRIRVDSLLTKNNSVTLIDYLDEEGISVPDKLFRKSKMTSFRSKY